MVINEKRYIYGATFWVYCLRTEFTEDMSIEDIYV